MTRVAVTGASGFIGSHTARALLAHGDDVVCIARHANPAAIPAGAHATWITADLEDEVALARAFAGCESVIHCAGINLERGKQRYDKVHVHGTQAIVQAARAAGVPRIALMSFLRPVAVQDVARILAASTHDPRLSNRTFPVLGPEEVTLAAAVRRVATAIGRQPVFIPMPVALHRGLAWLFERVMTIPLESSAQVRILAEGIVEPVLAPDRLPDDVVPTTPFSQQSIRGGLPAGGHFTRADLRVCSRHA